MGEGANKSSNIDKGEEYNMLHQNLHQMYQSTRQHSRPSKINIVVCKVPQPAQIESMFPFFLLSQSLVEEHQNLYHAYLKCLHRKYIDDVLVERWGTEKFDAWE